VTVIYPIRDTQIGGGEEDHVVFKSNSKTTFTFPFQFQYSVQADPDQAIIKDIFTKCGFMPGAQKQQLSLKYTLEVRRCDNMMMNDLTFFFFLKFSLQFKYCL
jgi:hypothetical protein